MFFFFFQSYIFTLDVHSIVISAENYTTLSNTALCENGIEDIKQLWLMHQKRHGFRYTRCSQPISSEYSRTISGGVSYPVDGSRILGTVKEKCLTRPTCKDIPPLFYATAEVHLVVRCPKVSASTYKVTHNRIEYTCIPGECLYFV